MVMNLCEDNISRLINGRVIPNDRVFYPVKPIVGTAVDDFAPDNVRGKVILITTSSPAKKDAERVKTLARQQWDALVDNFIYIPALITKEGVNAMAPEGAVQEPAKFKDSTGAIVIVGPDGPVGKKISGLLRARADVFRGALRPYTATVNQELSDVLGSAIRLYLVLAGNSEGLEPDVGRLCRSVLNLAAGVSLKRNEAIFY